MSLTVYVFEKRFLRNGFPQVTFQSLLLFLGLSDLCLMAQSVLFIVAGYDTTAALLSFTSFLLAKNKNQQQRLRDELRQMIAKEGGITYDGITTAKLLDACLQGEFYLETLRNINISLNSINLF